MSLLCMHIKPHCIQFILNHVLSPKVYMTQTGVFLEIELVFKRICGNKVESEEIQESHGIYTTMEKQENIT